MANWPTGPQHRDRVVRLDVAEFRGHVARRKDVGQEQDLLVGKSVLDLDRPRIGVRHAQVLGLAAGIASEEMGIAVQTGGRMAPQRLGLGAVRIGALAAGEPAPLAEEALAAGDGEGHDDAIADLQLPVLRSDLDHFAHGLVADDVTALHAGNDAVEDVQVGAADRAGGDLDDGVARMLDPGVRHALATHVALAVPGQRLHELLSVARGATPGGASTASESVFGGRPSGRGEACNLPGRRKVRRLAPSARSIESSRSTIGRAW